MHRSQPTGSGRAGPGDEPRIVPLRPVGTTMLADLAAPLVRAAAARVDVTADIPADIAVSGDAAAVTAAMATLIEAAVVAACAASPPSDFPSRPEVCITAVLTATGLEIEVADSGCGVGPPVTAGTVAERCGGRVTARPCPEGGRAVTLVLPTRPARRVAA
jgi:hypothetical protein